MEAREQVLSLLKSKGAHLLRTKKHNVYRLPSGRSYVLPSTPSDHRAWRNCLADLRTALGFTHEEKKQSDFEHKKKDLYVKPIETKEEFLAGLPEREERPPTPVTPPFSERKQLEEEKVDEPPDQEVISFYGRLPMAGPGRGNGFRKVSGRTGPVFTYSVEVLKRADFLQKTQGAQASKNYLDAVRNGNVPELKAQEEKDFMETNVTSIPPARTISADASLENLIKQKKDEIRVWTAQIDSIQLELARAKKVVETLEQALALTTASKSEIQTLTAMNGSAPLSKASNNSKGFWKTSIELALTSPISLTRKTLTTELQKLNPQCSYGAAYQGVCQGLKKGWLQEDNRGFVHFIRDKSTEGAEA